MRIRTPKNVSCPTDRQIFTSSNEHRFRVTLLTPMYGGGVKAGEVDADMPIRASAIRGQLRFWWRLLNQTKYPNSTALFRAERDIWGGLGNTDKEIKASKVLLRVENQPCKNQLATFSAADIPQYAIAVVRTGKTDDPHPQMLKTGTGFDLVVTCPEDLWGAVQETLRWWTSFGGLGARTRRGLGSVQVEKLDDCNKTSLLAPITAAQAANANCRLVQRVGKKKVKDAWSEAINRLRDFRQAPKLGRNPGQTMKRPGRSRWPEPDAIRSISNQYRVKESGIALVPEHQAGNLFPRALFGLPIIFHFQGEANDTEPDPADCELRPHGANRFASPLIIKAMVIGSDIYASIALLLPSHAQLRSKALELRGPSIPRQEFRMAAGDWWQAAQATHIRPMDRRGDDPLDAFLHYFEKG